MLRKVLIAMYVLVGAGCSHDVSALEVVHVSNESVWQAMNSHLAQLPLPKDGELSVRPTEAEVVVTSSTSPSWLLTVKLAPPFAATTLGAPNGKVQTADQRKALQVFWNLVRERSFQITRPFRIKALDDNYYHNFMLSPDITHEGGDLVVRVSRDTLKPEVIPQF